MLRQYYKPVESFTVLYEIRKAFFGAPRLNVAVAYWDGEFKLVWGAEHHANYFKASDPQSGADGSRNLQRLQYTAPCDMWGSTLFGELAVCMAYNLLDRDLANPHAVGIARGSTTSPNPIRDSDSLMLDHHGIEKFAQLLSNSRKVLEQLSRYKQALGGPGLQCQQCLSTAMSAEVCSLWAEIAQAMTQLFQESCAHTRSFHRIALSIAVLYLHANCTPGDSLRILRVLEGLHAAIRFESEVEYQIISSVEESVCCHGGFPDPHQGMSHINQELRSLWTHFHECHSVTNAVLVPPRTEKLVSVDEDKALPTSFLLRLIAFLVVRLSRTAQQGPRPGFSTLLTTRDEFTTFARDYCMKCESEQLRNSSVQAGSTSSPLSPPTKDDDIELDQLPKTGVVQVVYVGDDNVPPEKLMRSDKVSGLPTNPPSGQSRTGADTTSETKDDSCSPAAQPYDPRLGSLNAARPLTAQDLERLHGLPAQASPQSESPTHKLSCLAPANTQLGVPFAVDIWIHKSQLHLNHAR